MILRVAAWKCRPVTCRDCFKKLTPVSPLAELIHSSSLSLSRCPSHVNQDSNDILLLDFSAEVDRNQNCIKGKNAVVAPRVPERVAPPQTENPFSPTFGYFPTPDTDPFRDDPLSKSSGGLAPENPSLITGAAGNDTGTHHNDGGLNGDMESLSHQINGLSSENMILALSNGQWPLGGKISQGGTISLMDGSEPGPGLLSSNPFFDSPLKAAATSACDITQQTQTSPTPSKESVVINPPPQSSKAGRGRRSAKVTFQGQTNCT